MKRMLESSDLSPAEQSQAWLTALRGEAAERDRAIARLHDLMIRAARFELGRRRAALSHVRGEELDDIATQAADDAVMAVLAKLDDFLRNLDRALAAFGVVLRDDYLDAVVCGALHQPVQFGLAVFRAMVDRNQAGEAKDVPHVVDVPVEVRDAVDVARRQDSHGQCRRVRQADDRRPRRGR